MKRFVFLLMFLLGMNALAVEKPILEPASKKLVEQALAAEDAGDLRKAIALHKSVVAINPKNFISLNAIAGLYGVLRDFAAEVQWAKKSLVVEPNYHLAHVNLGNALLEQGNKAGAKKAFSDAISVAPREPEGYYSMGLLHEREGLIVDAAGDYKKSVEVRPTFAEGWLNLGAAQANMRNFTDARFSFNQALRLRPDFSDARQMLIQVEKDMKGGK